MYFSRTNSSVLLGQLITLLWPNIFQPFMDLFVVIRVCCWFNFHWQGLASASLQITWSLQFYWHLYWHFGFLGLRLSQRIQCLGPNFLGWNRVDRSVSFLFLNSSNLMVFVEWFACEIRKKYSTLRAISCIFHQRLSSTSAKKYGGLRGTNKMAQNSMLKLRPYAFFPIYRIFSIKRRTPNKRRVQINAGQRLK